MYKGKYTPLDLSLENIDGIEQKTIRREYILEDLWILYNRDEYLSEHEKDFIFNTRIKREQFKNSRLDENYFSSLYLIYANDLHGITKLYKRTENPVSENQMEELRKINFNSKTFQENRQILINANLLVEIGQQQSVLNILYLKESAKEWEDYLNVNRGKTTDKLLKEFIAETFTHLRELKRHILMCHLGNNAFLHRKLQLFLFSKYAFITSKKLSETFDKDKTYYELIFQNEKLRFNEYSLAHILMRHYAQGVRDYGFINEKSIHIGDVPFNEINKILELIFRKVDEAKILPNLFSNQQEIVNLRFSYKGNDYFLGTKIDKNQNEKGKIPFRRIETFYLIEDKSMLKELEDNFIKSKLEDDLYIYIKN